MSQQSNETALMVQGRIVWAVGNLFQGKVKTIYGTQTPMTGKDGQPRKEYGFGLAIPKQNCAEVWNAIQTAARSIYPQNVPPKFAWKFKDGDTDVDENGQPYNLREGYAGCIVLSCTTSLPVKFFKWDQQSNQNVQVSEGIQAGDYVNVQLSIKAHGPSGQNGQGNPGMYLNPLAAQLVGHGKPIINAPTGDQMFGTNAPVVPQGASSTPIAPTPGMLVPNAAPTQGYQQASVQPQQFQQPMQQQSSQPNWNVVPQQFAPQQQAAPMQQQYQQALQMGNGMNAQPPQQFAPPTQQYQPTVPQQQPNYGMPQTPGGMPSMQQQYQQAPQMPGMPPLPQ